MLDGGRIQVRDRQEGTNTNVWAKKGSRPTNRAYDDYDALEQAAIEAWREAVLDEQLVRSVCAAPYTKRATSD